MKVNKPFISDETGIQMARALRIIAEGIDPEAAAHSRVSSLDETALASGSIVEAVGIPAYVSADDLPDYAEYGLTDAGWYVFARISAEDGTTVGDGAGVTGAAGAIVTSGADHVDVAVKFEVAAQSKTVVITWSAGITDTYVFKASDLAVRNLDYRSTFYVYDISPFVEWTFGQTADATFAAGKAYYVADGEGGYEKATVTEGDPVPAYYEQGEAYQLTADATFQENKTYYTKDGDVYTEATVTPGEAVEAGTYYELVTVYTFTEDATFQGSKTYYTKSGDTYSAATVTEGEAVPAYFVHSKVTFSGMTRNVTYKLDEMVDCPIEIVLPVVPDDGYGAWFEIQMRFDNTYSITLLPTDPSVKIGTATTQAQSAGINVVDLQYTDVDDIQMWTLLNTHSNLPAAT